jgi:hypothetical protein
MGGIDGRCAGEREQAGGATGGALQQIGALELGCLRESGFEELAYHSEREIALQLSPPRPEHAHSALCSHSPRGIEQRRLADPSGPLDHYQRTPSCAGFGQRRGDPRQLVAALE